MSFAAISKGALPVARTSVPAAHQKSSPSLPARNTNKTTRASRYVLRTKAISAPERSSSLPDIELKKDADAITKSMLMHFKYTLGENPETFSEKSADAYRAFACTVSELLTENLLKTQNAFVKADQKYGYYLSMEFLQGRALLNAIENLEIEDEAREALAKVGYTLENMVSEELDAALGNGGLGRLAACFLDSMATLNLPMFGYGIRYNYGMFKQLIEDGFQKEAPDYWLNLGNPWEIQRPNVAYEIPFFGEVKNGKWTPKEAVMAVAYDNPIPGWKTDNTISLRLWSARPIQEFDLAEFNIGHYTESCADRQKAETITSVLYPEDSTQEGKTLRLKQQFFFTSASLQDIIARFLAAGHTNWDELPEHAAVQLNDTHPTIGVAELMRLLMDVHGLEWEQSWKITGKVLAYTNHTVLPEALEKWSAELIEELLPRHMEIIKIIDTNFQKEFKGKVDKETMARMKPIGEDEWGKGEDVVRMASLAMAGSHTVNGVAAVHSELLKITVLKDFYKIMPEKFQNKTNGVTQRRWLAFCNPELRALISKQLGHEDWIGDMSKLTALEAVAEDPAFQAEWMACKRNAKVKLAELVKERTGYTISPDSLFDVQIKRIHEYKRQLLNIIRCIDSYTKIKAMTPDEKAKLTPKVVMVGGKAAAGYAMAKKIIKLINAVGAKVNNDPDVGDLLKVIFIPNYNVSAAEVIIPGTELSQQISTAGTEASGTSNMKFAMNGGLLIGTMDGANIEIWEEIGEENGFIFGCSVEEVDGLLEAQKDFIPCADFTNALKRIEEGDFGEKKSEFYQMILDALAGEDGAHYLPQDFYLLGRDFPSYIKAVEEADALYQDQAAWTKKSILSVAHIAKFSTDRTIAQYAEEIWNVKPCKA
mmetsp:Transcript_32108/g.44512  ORF Transcript_32108/g.44512 Transcript_32108/m.44512 type:complete len:878 (+) Transcript_32108:118-2751(+)|eukprot:CAMPEP_0196580168 /NCGR_PEP_ID=MMETSP1081-20130531/27543_1 /TAXON_ID=36882 /ORGANISM="Pyramimonas amylifera, Strain CCMP720" /LENGTH=877 /DNA_ID=CAMNT_0041899969 /DNA_START=112 /DNA_END=2745 /DNA_ORIENTATION=+